MATLPRHPEMTPEELFLDHLKLIQAVAAHACRRYRLSREYAEDFPSWVIEKIIDDNNYGPIRKYQGKSNFRTYITIVINRLMLDYRNHIWGRWRNSAEAERLGPVAAKLEVLLVREGRPFEEACEILWTNDRVEVSREALADLAGKLPLRNPPRRMEGEQALQNQPGCELDPEQLMLEKERAVRKRKVLGLLKAVMAILPDEDQVIVKMRGELQVVQIARTLRLEQKPLYRRLDKIFKTLRTELEKRGVNPDDIGDILGGPDDPEGPEDHHGP